MSIDPNKFGLSPSLLETVKEALKGNQHKIDVNKNGKIDGDDFKKLRGENAKPDYIDIDKDGNKKEPMKHAAKHAKEEVEQVDEISKATLGSYIKKASASAATHTGAAAAYGSSSSKPDPKKMAQHQAVATKRQTGINKAVGKLTKEEALDEKAVSQAQQKAAGAALATQRGEYAGGKKGGAVNRMALMKRSELEKIASTKRKGLPMRKEEVEQVDEISDKVKNSYIHKADKQVTGTNAGLVKKDGGLKVRGVSSADFKRKYDNRKAGIKRAMGEDAEVEMTEADDAVAKQIAAKKDAMKKQIQQKIAQKQMSTMQAKANKRLSSINASSHMDKEDEKEMKKGGKEKIEINPAMRD